jgi:hypothetical protein
MRHAAALAKAAVAARHLADALQELATAEQVGVAGELAGGRRKSHGRRGVRIPADAPTMVDEITAKRAQRALRRAGIVTR